MLAWGNTEVFLVTGESEAPTLARGGVRAGEHLLCPSKRKRGANAKLNTIMGQNTCWRQLPIFALGIDTSYSYLVSVKSLGLWVLPTASCPLSEQTSGVRPPLC